MTTWQIPAASAGSIADLLAGVHSKGVKVWAENGRLHYQAPKGTLTHEELERLRGAKDRIISFFESLAGPRAIKPGTVVPHGPSRVPLSLSQSWHWQTFRLSDKRSARSLACATRLRGPLHIESLRCSLATLVARHDALRTRIVMVDGAPLQEIAESSAPELKVHDLTGFPRENLSAALCEFLTNQVARYIDLVEDPLFEVSLLRLGVQDSVLLMSMDHLISDAVSLNLVLEDLLALYLREMDPSRPPLPSVPVQYGDYTLWQNKHQRAWVSEYGPYWSERFRGCERGRLAPDVHHMAGSEGWAMIPVCIGRGLTADLRQWSRQRGTTPAMSVLTAYIALISRWCQTPTVWIQFQTSDRSRAAVERTVGYFASLLCLRVATNDVSFEGLLKRVMREYCRAVEKPEGSCVATQLSHNTAIRNTVFNWVPHLLGTPPGRIGVADHELSVEPVHFDNTTVKQLRWDNDPELALCDGEYEIRGGLYFPSQRFSVESMERLSAQISVFLTALLRTPRKRVIDVQLSGSSSGR